MAAVVTAASGVPSTPGAGGCAKGRTGADADEPEADRSCSCPGEDEEEEDESPIGLEVWPAARAMLAWLATAQERPGGDMAPAAGVGCDGGVPDVRGATLLEFGAGTGFLARGLAKAGAHRVYATEGEPAVLENLRRETLEAGCDAVVPLHWDWVASAGAVPDGVSMRDVDLVIGTDLVYVGTEEGELAAALATALGHPLGRPGLRALLIMCDRPPGGEQFLPNPRPDSGTRAVDRFLRGCAAQDLCVREIRLPEDMDVPGLPDYAERLASSGSTESLRLFEVKRPVA